MGVAFRGILQLENRSLCSDTKSNAYIYTDMSDFDVLAPASLVHRDEKHLLHVSKYDDFVLFSRPGCGAPHPTFGHVNELAPEI